MGNRKTRARCWFLIVALSAPGPLLAAAAGKVESVQLPAWIQRGNGVRPVTPGMALEPGDILRTGQDARLLLRLAEGSHVKLGANAELVLQAFKPPDTPGGFFEGLLDVAKGAFRFTTTLLSKAHRRTMNVRIANVTAGIRGTDVWGKAASDRDIVCLIEGEVTVERGTDPPLTLSDPLTFYIAPKNRPALPVKPVDPAQLQRWAEETDPRPDGPVLSLDGAWTVYLESLSTRESAQASKRRLEQQGYPVEIRSAEVNGVKRYRVAVTGFAHLHGARGFSTRAAAALGFPTAWVAKK